MIIPTKFGDATVLGAFKVAQKSGNTVSLAAAAHLARIRWAPSAGQANFCVVKRIKVGWSVQGAVTAATQMDLQLVFARAFSVDFTTNITKIDMASTSDTQKMKTSYTSSAMGVNGPGIATTAAMSGQTLTADAAPLAMQVFVNQPSGNATVTQAIGVGGAMATMYEWAGGMAEVPITLAFNEGLLIQPVTASVVSGAINYYVEWEWLEVVSL